MSWTTKKAEHWRIDALNCGAEDSLESLGQQGDQTSLFWRKLTLSSHWKDWCWSWSSNTLATWREELTEWKRSWCWERLKAGGEVSDTGCDGWMALPTNGHEFEQTLEDSKGKGSLVCCSPWSYKESDMTYQEKQQQHGVKKSPAWTTGNLKVYPFLLKFIILLPSFQLSLPKETLVQLQYHFCVKLTSLPINNFMWTDKHYGNMYNKSSFIFIIKNYYFIYNYWKNEIESVTHLKNVYFRHTTVCHTIPLLVQNHIQMPPIWTYFLECYKCRVISSASAKFYILSLNVL